MFSPAVLQLAKNLGANLSERDAHASYAFDGQTIATHKRRYLDDDLYEIVPLTDHDILHELGHWVMAEECQRDLPEFGLALGVAIAAYGPPGGEFLDLYGNIRSNVYQGAFEGVVDKGEQDIQEQGAQLLSSYWGRSLGVGVDMASDPGFFRDWNHYDFYKTKEANQYGWLGDRMIAMQRLMRMDIIHV